MTDYLTGQFLQAWATASLAGLSRHRSEINRLNVFPIPDSDTGTNMVATMKCAVDRMRALDSDSPSTAADVAAALAAGAVSGARGNSGMVLSQIFRAIADTASMSATGDLSARAVPVMLSRAEELVTEALSDPVEGTIVTVLRAAAAGAQVEVNADPTAILDVVVTAALDAALAALERTTGQLDALSDAGVVDAGGRGLVVILQALVDALRGEDGAGNGPTRGSFASDVPGGGLVPGIGVLGSHDGRDARGGSEADAHEETQEEVQAPHLELVFGFRGDAGLLRRALEELGDSVVIVRDGSSDGHQEGYRAHVHTVAAGELLERIFSLGEVHGLHIEVLPASPRRSATPPAFPVIALLPAQPGRGHSGDGEGTRDNTGLARLFASAGAAVGDSPASLSAALEAVDGPGIVLTNGQDTRGLFEVLDGRGLEVTVVDTGSFVGGLAALAVYSPAADAEDNAEDMADAVHGQRWRDVLDGGTQAVTTVVRELLDEGGELVTVLHGDTLAREDLVTVSAAVTSSHPEAEIHGVHVPGLEIIAQVGVE